MIPVRLPLNFKTCKNDRIPFQLLTLRLTFCANLFIDWEEIKNARMLLKVKK